MSHCFQTRRSMLLLKKLLSSIFLILATVLLIFPARGDGQTISTVRPAADGRPVSEQAFAEADLKAFINTIFLTAQEVRPELRAAGLRLLATVIGNMETARALWVYDQAFKATEQISAPNTLALRQALEREVILEEAKLDLKQAIDHALALQEELVTPEGTHAGENVKLVLLADLVRRITDDDADSLFQKIAPVLVREDNNFDQTLTIAEFFQKNHPERSQQLFNHAVAKFYNLPAAEASLDTFATLTRTVGATNPNLAEMGIDVLLRKADEIDSKLSPQKSGDPQPPGPSEGVYGPTHLLVLSQFLPLMRQINPGRGDDWIKALQDKRNQDGLKQASSGRVYRPNLGTEPRSPINTGSSTSPRTGQPNAPGIERRGSPPPSYFDPRGGANTPGVNPDQPAALDQMMNLAAQPTSAFSLPLTQDLVKAQTLSKNQPVEYSHRLEGILPRLQLENNPQAKASALAQIALAYFQMGETVQARKYVSECLAQSLQGDSSLLRNSTTPALFFTMYSATSNAVTKLVPLFPREAIEAAKSIPDSQLRLRVMIDAIRSLSPLISTSGRKR
ncbi:MAG: hypothetical protein LAO31_07150 [Acidobacteriia bacterium]|nr:hypothetical protein [Terriglobia bacterium]